MYLSDISFINEGQPNQDNGLINFLKFSKIARVIAEIQYFQDTSSAITERDDIAAWWRVASGTLISERDAHARSLKLEAQGEQEDSEAALAEAAGLRKENEALQVRVAQLEQLSTQQQDTIEKLTQKLNAMQRDLRMTRDITQMMNAARTPAASPTTAYAPSAARTNAIVSPRSAPERTPVPAPPSIDHTHQAPKQPTMQPLPALQPFPALSETPLPSSSPPHSPKSTPAAPVDDELAATQKQLQENAAKLAGMREKYKARQAGTDAATAPAGSAPAVSSPVAARRIPDATTPPAASSPKGSKLQPPVRPKPAEEEPIAPAHPSASAAAALREKFKIAGKTSSSPGMPSPGRTDQAYSSAPGESDLSTSPAQAEDPSALLERMRALRDNYKKEPAPPVARAATSLPGGDPPAASGRALPQPPGAKPAPKAIPRPAVAKK